MTPRPKPNRRAFIWPAKNRGYWIWNYEVQEQTAPGKRWGRLVCGTISRDGAATRGQARALIAKDHDLSTQQIVVRR